MELRDGWVELLEASEWKGRSGGGDGRRGGRRVVPPERLTADVVASRGSRAVSTFLQGRSAEAK